MKKTISKVFALCMAVALLVASFGTFAYAYGTELLSTYAGIENSASADGFWFDAEDLTVEHDGPVRGAPYVGYLRDHATPKHISGGDGDGPFWGIDSDEDYNNYMNFNPGSYFVHDYYIESAYKSTIDIKLDSEFAAGHFAALRFGLSAAEGAEAISDSSKGVTVAFDVADSSKDTIKIGAYDSSKGQVYYTVDLANGALHSWKSIKVVDNIEGTMKIYCDNTLLATVTLSAVKGDFYTAMTVADANGETKVTANAVSVCTDANMNIGVAQNADSSIVTTGGLYMDNWSIVEYEESEDNKPTEAPADPTEAPADPTEAPADPTEEPAGETEKPADKTEKPADKTSAPATSAAPADKDVEDGGSNTWIIIVAIVAAVAVVAAVVVVIILKKKKA